MNISRHDYSSVPTGTRASVFVDVAGRFRALAIGQKEGKYSFFVNKENGDYLTDGVTDSLADIDAIFMSTEKGTTDCSKGGNP